MDFILDFLRDTATGPVLVIIAAGLLIALVAWLPLALRGLPLSLPVVCVAIGAAIFSLPHVPPVPSPLDRPHIAERYAEFIVIVALMGAGLKIDRIFGVRRWRITWRLILLTMPLSILAIALLGGFWMGLPWAAAVLLAAALAPTDPVMAADVQVGPPRTGAEDEVRFGLTSEAGLNDGAAFPFVHLAIAMSLAAATGEPFLRDWFLEAVLWEIAAGVGCGWLIGRAFGWITFRIPAETKLAQTGDGMIALAATFVSYGVTEAVNGYGFLAVFVAALAFRDAHRTHDFHREMHDITEQVERVAMMVLLIFFGGALVGGLLAPLRAVDVAGVLAILLVIRPLAGWLGLAGLPLAPGERWVIAVFGIRGVGSIYYLAYGLNHMQTGEGARLWAITGLVVLCSVLMHGLTVTPIMRRLDRGRGDDPDAPDAPDGPRGTD
ncbi:cation:proton antiporter [Frigidibacter oleivorans]|uniref:cation:proton antiporter n=1 Tax=Frigidibacter oleivorans TaxID=2487129 RepID=UPI000F8E20C3|nr:cation:proton antiporter [Frigidibacter oleivorans]